MALKATARLLITGGAGLGVTAVPLVGFFWAGWTPATAMVLYLLENLLGAGLVVLRVQLLRPRAARIDRYEASQRREWIQTYLLVVGAFSAGCALFMSAFLFLIMRLPLELTTLRAGLANISIFLLIGFIADLLLGHPLDLAGVEACYKRSLGRVCLLFLSVFIGIWLAAIREPWFLLPFVFLKTMADLDEPLQWVVVRVQQVRST